MVILKDTIEKLQAFKSYVVYYVPDIETKKVNGIIPTFRDFTSWEEERLTGNKIILKMTMFTDRGIDIGTGRR